MKTIKEPVTNELIIKNSKFITIIKPLNKIEDFDDMMNNIKRIYKNATHYCYAYIINDVKRSNDDGEPTGTAGDPILNVLLKNKLTNIFCIVIRYFGGIKLGAGGLIRAYGKSVTEALKIADIKDICECHLLTIEFTYENLKIINSLMKNLDIINKDFDKKITYSIIIKKNYDEIIKHLEALKIDIVEIKKITI